MISSQAEVLGFPNLTAPRDIRTEVANLFCQDFTRGALDTYPATGEIQLLGPKILQDLGCDRYSVNEQITGNGQARLPELIGQFIVELVPSAPNQIHPELIIPAELVSEA